MSPTGPAPDPRAPIKIGGVVMFLVGLALLIIPGGCSLLFTIGALIEAMSSRRDQYGFIPLALIASTLGFTVAAFGYWLMRKGKQRRASPAASPASLPPTNPP